MNEVNKLIEVDSVPNKDLLELTEKLLQDVKCGKVIAFIGYGVYKNRKGIVISSNMTRTEACGYISRLNYLFHKYWDKDKD